MKRKIYETMLEWKNDYNGKSALLIEGARRVGKSFIAEEFAKNNYKSYILIDFSKATDEVKNLFNNYINDLDNFFLYLTAFYGIELYERESVIIFDEVQLFPQARSSIKHLVADGRYDYIETGSLMSIKENVENILIPSEEHSIKMYPMDFEEFLWANNDNILMDFIKKCFNEHKPLGAVHKKAMDYFKKYLIVGGMPQVVKEYVENNCDFKKCDIVKRDILSLYRNDMYKRASNYGLKVEAIYDSIPDQLQRHDKKFRITALDENAKARDYNDAFLWLGDAMIANIAFNTTEPSVGLKLNRDTSTYKLYFLDTGLLLAHAFDQRTIVVDEIYKKILFDQLELNKGMLIENIVAQMLVAAGNKLFFYSNYSRESEDRMEIDFLITSPYITRKHNIIPLEVKSGKNYTLTSLNKFKNKYSNFLSTPYVIHTGDYKEENGVIYLPIYMTSLL